MGQLILFNRLTNILIMYPGIRMQIEKEKFLDIKQYTGNPIQVKMTIIIEITHFRHRGLY